MCTVHAEDGCSLSHPLQSISTLLYWLLPIAKLPCQFTTQHLLRQQINEVKIRKLITIILSQIYKACTINLTLTSNGASNITEELVIVSIDLLTNETAVIRNTLGH